MKRPSLLYLQGGEQDGEISVRVGGRAIVAGRGYFEL